MKDLAEALGLEDEKREIVKVLPKEDIEPCCDPKKEAEVGLKHAAEVASEALSEAAYLAKDSQHPRMYEALTGLIKAAVDANKELMNIQELDIDIKKKKQSLEDGDSPKSVTNNLVMSTDDLMKLLEKKRDAE